MLDIPTWADAWGVLYDTALSDNTFSCELFIANNPSNTVYSTGKTFKKSRENLFLELEDHVWKRCLQVEETRSSS